MKISNFSSDWILSDELSSLKQITTTEDIVNKIFKMPEETGDAIFSRFILPLGIAISNAKSFYKKKIDNKFVKAPPVKIDFKENTLFFQNLKSGRNILHEEISNQIIDYGKNHDHIRFQKELVITNNFSLAEDVDLYTLSIPEGALLKMIGESAANQLLEKYDFINFKGGLAIEKRQIANLNLHDAFNNIYSNDILKIYLQSKSMEFIAAFYAENFFQKKTGFDRSESVIIEIREYLIHCGKEVPTLNSLSEKFGRPAGVLNEQFKKRYGKSIIKFLMDQRLHQAHDAIQNSKIPLKVISDRIGYSHVNNFTAAFKKYFGYPPGKLRRTQ